MGYGTKSAYFHPINLYFYKYQLKAKIYCQTFGLFFLKYLPCVKKNNKTNNKANGHTTPTMTSTLLLFPQRQQRIPTTHASCRLPLWHSWTGETRKRTNHRWPLSTNCFFVFAFTTKSNDNNAKVLSYLFSPVRFVQQHGATTVSSTRYYCSFATCFSVSLFCLVTTFSICLVQTNYTQDGTSNASRYIL